MATKLASFRPQDKVDLRLLVAALGLRDADVLVSIAIDVYGDYLTMFGEPDELRLRADAVVARMQQQKPGGHSAG